MDEQKITPPQFTACGDPTCPVCNGGAAPTAANVLFDESTKVAPVEPKPPKRKWHQRLAEAVGTALGEWFASRR